jgi:hypothetical protein
MIFIPFSIDRSIIPAVTVPPLSHLTSCTPTKYTLLIPWQLLWPWPIRTPHVPCAKSHIPLQLLMLYWRIGLIPSLLTLFRNMINFLRWGVFSISHQQPLPPFPAGGPPLVGCQRLLVQYIRSYLPQMEAVSPTATWEHTMPWWQGLTYQSLHSNKGQYSEALLRDVGWLLK